ncbi:ABC transporter ATP-binding protein [Vibrio viridaestus]|uniref:ABC transporter ATP-binding protein n=1 Tax=Vibrio viridaestus TaxID=2487322 RepID=A0A3N9TXC6_9VIBR|nr:ABC transporter ATP-binding protein [Vibrio viridaestus]RQW61582.1 ABC transporter ATP-binding protein [Vibrio viridaestus]
MNKQQSVETPYVIEMNQCRFQWTNTQDPVINIDTFRVKRGEHVFVKGPSGCGKSTLLSLITGINTPQAGEITVLGTKLNSLSSSQRDRFRADNIGYIFQQFNLLPYLSVIENVVLPCQFSHKRMSNLSGSLKEKAKQLLSRLKLPDELLAKSVIELSIGQQQRVAAARALIGAPDLIIADEPTSALDYDNRKSFIELLLEEAKASNSTLVFVSHDPTLEPLFTTSLNLSELNIARASK